MLAFFLFRSVELKDITLTILIAEFFSLPAGGRSYVQGAKDRSAHTSVDLHSSAHVHSGCPLDASIAARQRTAGDRSDQCLSALHKIKQSKRLSTSTAAHGPPVTDKQIQNTCKHKPHPLSLKIKCQSAPSDIATVSILFGPQT